MSSAAIGPEALSSSAATPLTCKSQVNSFGSRYWAFFADRELIVRIAGSEIEKSFRRVVLDPARGLILLMSPARAHERVSELTGDTIKGLASLLQVPLVSLGSARWRRPSDPPNTGPEADCCFYVGERAKGYLAAEARGEADADRFVLDHPPDIVVEVGVTHVDADKLKIYQDRGVPEYWQVDRGKDGPTQTVRFVSLPQMGAPEKLLISKMLPGVTPELFEEALQSAAHRLDGLDALAATRGIMEAHGAIGSSPRSDSTCDEGPTPP